MPTRCIANGCRNTANPTGKTATQIKFEKVMKITFHSFPSDPVRRAEWIKIMKLEDKTVSKRSRLCSLHFKEKYIDRTSLVYVRLRENAIPHIFEDTLCDNPESSMGNKRETLPAQSVETTNINDPPNIKMEHIEQNSVIFRPLKMDMENNIEQDSVICRSLSIKMDIKDNLAQDSVIYSVCDKETNTALFLLQENRKSTEVKETRMSPERIWTMNFSNMEASRQERCTKIKNLHKRALQKKVWQKRKRITIMETILDELKIKFN